jgi:hypothetical protein
MLHPASDTANLITEALEEVLQCSTEGRAIAQAVSRRITTAEPGFEPRLGHVGFVVDEAVLSEVFSEYFRFPLSILIPPTAPSSYIIRVWYTRSISGRRTKWTQSHPHSTKLKNTIIKVTMN